MIPIIPKKENPVNTIVNSGNISGADNISKDNVNDDNLGADIKDVTIGDFSKFVRIQDTLEKQIEKRSLRNQPGISFGEKLGAKIEEKVSDTFIDRMLGGMFKVDGMSKPDGWLAVVKTVLDSGFAQQAGAKLPETIEALSKTIGPQKTDQLADAVVQAVNPKAKSIEDEQKKMEDYVLSLSPVNVVDLKKFIELVNSNPSNAKITDITQARNILVEEQDRIRKSTQMLSLGQQYIEENPDIDRGQRFPPSSYPGQKDNFMDNMMDTVGTGNYNQMTSEQILSLDPRDDASVTAYAWSQGHGQILQEPNGINKVRNILMRHQDDLMKQASGLGGLVEQPINKIEPEILEVPKADDIDSKWSERDINKKSQGVGKMDSKGEMLAQTTADSPVKEIGEIGTTPKENESSINSMMDILQKMASNFDTNMNDINSKLQMMENRILKVESTNIEQVEVEIPETEEIPEKIVEEESKSDESDKHQIPIESGDISPPLVDIRDTKDTKWWKNKKDDIEETDTIEEIDTPKKHAKGSMGWLREQKKKQAKKYPGQLGMER